MRNNNIKHGNKANERIINYLKGCGGIYGIYEIGDYQSEKWNRTLTPIEQMHNSINQYLGTDYIVITEGTKYRFQNMTGEYEKLNGIGFNIVNVDTKGFNYNPKYYGKLENGIVETMLLQVEKYYGKVVYNGWANNPNHLTEYILILLNNHIYFISYRKLVEYCRRFNRGNISYEKFNKGNGNYEICIKASVKDMIENKVITSIKQIS